MQQFVRREYAPGRILSLVVIWAATSVFSLPAAAQSMRKYGLSEMVKRADQIFVGQCVEKEVVVRNGSLVSRYTLRPNEVLKGKNTQNSDVIVEELGGELRDSPLPMGQYVTGMADLKKGEEVLLFTAPPQVNPKVEAARQAREREIRAKGVTPVRTIDPKAMRIVGLNQGHYTIVTDTESGRKFVTPGQEARASFERREALDEQTSGPLKIRKTTTAGLRDLNDPAKARRLAEKAVATDQILPLEPLDQVKQRISQLVQNSK